MYFWLTGDGNGDGISLTLEDDDDNYSSTEVSSFLEDGGLVLLKGVRRISSNGWIISEKDMSKVLGCIGSDEEEEEEEEEDVREDDEEDGEEEGDEGSQEEGTCAEGDTGVMGA